MAAESAGASPSSRNSMALTGSPQPAVGDNDGLGLLIVGDDADVQGIVQETDVDQCLLAGGPAFVRLYLPEAAGGNDAAPGVVTGDITVEQRRARQFAGLHCRRRVGGTLRPGTLRAGRQQGRNGPSPQAAARHVLHLNPRGTGWESVKLPAHRTSQPGRLADAGKLAADLNGRRSGINMPQRASRPPGPLPLPLGVSGLRRQAAFLPQSYNDSF